MRLNGFQADNLSMPLFALSYRPPRLRSTVPEESGCDRALEPRSTVASLDDRRRVLGSPPAVPLPDRLRQIGWNRHKIPAHPRAILGHLHCGEDMGIATGSSNSGTKPWRTKTFFSLRLTNTAT